ETHHISVLAGEAGVTLDDEQSPSEAFAYSAEVVRFFGWIRRECRKLGERMVFGIDPRDPRPELAIRQFLTNLHDRGALRGRSAESAFSFRISSPTESTVIVDVAIAPSYPIDSLRLTFVPMQGLVSIEEVPRA